MKEVREDAMKHFKQTKDNILCLLLGEQERDRIQSSRNGVNQFKLKVNTAELKITLDP